jgi:hypothetical protein
MMKMIQLLSCLLIIAAMHGCGPSQPSTTKVTGTVTYNGEPVEGATVVFGAASEGGRAATGVTDSAGKFTLTTFEQGDGAVPGSYTVAISKTETIGGMSAEEEHAAMEAGEEVEEAETIQHLPEKYLNGPTSGLTAEVTADGRNDFTFELTDDESSDSEPSPE